MLYVADRLADSMTGHALEERHRFHRQHQAVLAVSWLGSAPLLLLLVLHLSHALREGWLLLGIPLAVYVAAVHALGLKHVPKEPLIATFFGVAVTLPMLAAGLPPIKFAATGVLFALLCWLNCAAITAWEASNDGYTDPLTAWVGRHVPAVAAVLMVLAAGALLRSAALEQAGRPAIAIALAALALLMLHTFRARFQRTSLRALADLCLMTPLLLIAGPVR